MPSMTEDEIRPLAQTMPCLPFRRSSPTAYMQAHLSGEAGPPAVYFVRIGRSVKIGTSRNVRKRIHDLYLGPADILALVPGNRYVEREYHRRFNGGRLGTPGRKELFRLDWRLRLFLAGCRFRWTEAVGAYGVACALTVASGSLSLGAVALASALAGLLLRLGWCWQ
jgi:hypothetical protein